MAAITAEIEIEVDEYCFNPAQQSAGITTAEKLMESVKIYYQGRLVEGFSDLEEIILELDQKELIEALEEEAAENDQARAEDAADWAREAWA